MYIFVLIIHIIASLVLVLVILLQAGRGGGLSEAFGGGAAQTIFGTKAATFLTRATAVCAVLFLITSLSLAVLSGLRTKSLLERAPITGQPQQQIPAEGQPQVAGTKKIRHVQIDPKTGKEIVVKEEVVPAETQPEQTQQSQPQPTQETTPSEKK